MATKQWEFDYWGGALPEHIGAYDVDVLIEVVAEHILQDAVIQDALNHCNLQPTTGAARLAASILVHGLILHERGQEVARDGAKGE